MQGVGERRLIMGKYTRKGRRKVFNQEKNRQRKRLTKK